MSTQAFDVIGELRRLVADGSISEDALQRITGAGPSALRSVLDPGSSPTAGLSAASLGLSDDETARLSTLAVQLSTIAEIDDDERLQAILQTLIEQFGLTLRNIERLTGVAEADLENALHDPDSLSADTKYTLALRGTHLLTAVANATTH